MKYSNPGGTAIVRKRPSVPARYLVGRFPNLNGKKRPGVLRVLDYGCGFGTDAMAFGWGMYDPAHGFTHPVQDGYDVIVCTYVLNVVSKKDEAIILDHIRKLLKPWGRAYVTVRADIKKGTKSQRNVKLGEPWELLHKTPGYRMYARGLGQDW